MMRVIGRLTGLPFGPSSPGGPLGPAGPAAPDGPDSPFSPRSPFGPCSERVAVRKVVHHITAAAAAFLFSFYPRAISQRGQKTETRSETAAKRHRMGNCSRVKGNQQSSCAVHADLQVSRAAGVTEMKIWVYERHFPTTTMPLLRCCIWPLLFSIEGGGKRGLYSFCFSCNGGVKERRADSDAAAIAGYHCSSAISVEHTSSVMDVDKGIRTACNRPPVPPKAGFKSPLLDRSTDRTTSWSQRRRRRRRAC